MAIQLKPLGSRLVVEPLEQEEIKSETDLGFPTWSWGSR